MSTVSTYPNSTYLILDGLAAAGTSVDLAAGVLSVGDPLQVLCKYNAITKASITSPVAETPGVETLTPIAAANSVYQFIIQQYNLSTGVTYTGTYTYTTAAAGDTATTICNAFRSQINNDQVLKVTATGAATLILTADAGFPLFTVTILQVGGGLTKATVAPDYVPGVAAVGTTAALALQGITVTGADYTTCHIEYSPVSGQNIKDGVAVASVIDIYVNDADDTGFVAALTTYLDGSSAADATAVI